MEMVRCLPESFSPAPTSGLIPIGIDDFRVLREQNFEYIDKTNLITEFIDRRNVKVVLLPRPRRFGKSMNLSMLKWFFQKRTENLWHLFEDLHVARAGEQYRAHFQKYPVIHISFKETKANDFDLCRQNIRRAIRTQLRKHPRELWNILVFAGYLKAAREVAPGRFGQPRPPEIGGQEIGHEEMRQARSAHPSRSHTTSTRT
jgi:hypothetical protein